MTKCFSFENLYICAFFVTQSYSFVIWLWYKLNCSKTFVFRFEHVAMILWFTMFHSIINCLSGYHCVLKISQFFLYDTNNYILFDTDFNWRSIKRVWTNAVTLFVSSDICFYRCMDYFSLRYENICNNWNDG